MAPEWYYIHDGQTEGPVSGQRLKELNASGHIGPTDLVWREGMADWLPAKALGLASGRTSTAPPAPPPGRSPVVLRPPVPASRRSPERGSAGWILLLICVLAIGIAGGWWGRSLAHLFSQEDQERAENVRLNAERPQKNKATGTASRSASRTTRTIETDDLGPAVTSTTGDSEFADPVTEEPEDAPRARSEIKIDSRRPAVNEPPAAAARPAEPLVFYQQITVHRTPTIAVQGIEFKQELQYRVQSQLTLQTQENSTARFVQQQITDAVLERADDMSRASYEDAVRKLKGMTFSFRLAANGEVEEFKGFKESRSAKSLDRRDETGHGETGYMVTSLLDEDGWKELTRLTFFRPPPQQRSAGWQQQMSHDWGPFGSWRGLTTFTQRSTGDAQPIEYQYTHAMTYEPPGMPTGGLPFPILEATFEPVAAAGVLHYDERVARITDAEEQFHVRGTIRTELLGQPADLQMEEMQTISIRLADQP